MADAEKAKIRHQVSVAVEKAKKAMPVDRASGKPYSVPAQERQRHGLLQFIAENAKTAGIMGCIALALSFSQKSSSYGVWIVIGGACVFVFLLAHEHTADKPYRWLRTLVLAVPWSVLLLAYGWWAK